MDVKLIKKLMGKIVPKNGYGVPECIKYTALVHNGVLRMTDITAHLEIDIDEDQWVYDPETCLIDTQLFSKTLNLQTSRAPGEADPTEWPHSLPDGSEIEAVQEIHTQPFTVGLSKFQKYCSTDITKGTLIGVRFNPARDEIAATEGHKLITEKTDGITEGFILPGYLCSVIDDLGTPDYAELYRTKSDRTYLRLSGDGWKLTVQTVEGPYPGYEKVIPEPVSIRTYEVTKDNVRHLIAGLKQVLPYANSKTHLIMLHNGQVLRTVNRETRKNIRLDLCTEFADMTSLAYDTIGINGQYTIEVLTDALDIPGETIRLSWPGDAAGAISIQHPGRCLMIMPLRIVDDSLHSDCGIPVENLILQKSKPAPVKKPKLDREIERVCLGLQKRIGKAELLNNLNAMELV